MLGHGKNLNLNVSAIKEKNAFASMFKSVGDGLGSSAQGIQIDDLFTDKKVNPNKSEIKEPNFEDTLKKQQQQKLYGPNQSLATHEKKR